jgi:hypothetical protein
MKDHMIALNILAKLREQMIYLIDKILQENNTFEIVEILFRIQNKMKTVKIKENDNENFDTSYTVNKGDEIIICLRSKINNKIHNFNQLIYIMIHEISHIGSLEIGHTRLFFNINKFLLKKAIKYNIYKYKNYKKIPIKYCGIVINNNILNDI